MTQRMLNHLKALDLTDNKGWFCGQLMADLGVEVVKVEPPGGDPSRMLGPFFGHVVHPERSLYWFGFNAGKRGITVNLESPQGRELLQELSREVDFLIESYSPGHMKELGLGYDVLSKANSGLIYTSITPFGQTGPWRDYKGSDLTLQALSGVASCIGEPEREPLRMCLDQSYLLSGCQAAIGCLMALQYRNQVGIGQQIDVSIYDCLVRLNYREPVVWDIENTFTQRQGTFMVRANVRTRTVWKCKDGYVSWILIGGAAGAKENVPLTKWLASEKIPGAEELQKVDWNKVDFSKTSQEQIESWEEIFGRLFANHTKQELWETSLKQRLTVMPIMNIEEAFEFKHFRSRGFWHSVDYPHLNTSLEHPGYLFLSNNTSSEVPGPAPLIGEHNDEILSSWLNLSKEQIDDLKRQKAI